MLPISDAVKRVWKTGVYPLRNRVEIFFPTPVTSAAGSTEFSSNFPAAAVFDGDRTHINAGPFDREEQGYGPADNLIGKGMWMGKHINHNPVFRFEGANGFAGNAWYSSNYYAELDALTDPLDNPDYPNPHMMAKWRMDNNHWDLQPHPGLAGGQPDVLVDSSVYANHSIWVMGQNADFGFSSWWQNHNLGWPSILKGERTASAFISKTNWAFAAAPQPVYPSKGMGQRIPIYASGRNTLNFWIMIPPTSTGGILWNQSGVGSVPNKPGITRIGHTVSATFNQVTCSIGGISGGGTINTLDPTKGGHGNVLTLNDGLPHMVTVVMGKQTGGYWLWEIYVDGEQEADLVVSGGYSPEPMPATSLMYHAQNPYVFAGGPGNSHGGVMQASSWHNWPWYGVDKPDYAPGVVAYNQIKYMWEQGANGILHPGSVVAPIFSGTAILGDLLVPDFAGGSSLAEGFDGADDPAQYQLYDPTWLKIAATNSIQTGREFPAQFMIAQDDVLPPGATGKCAKIFSKAASKIQSFSLTDPPLAGGPTCAYWGKNVTPATSGKLVFQAMVHQQGTNPGKGHVMYEAWQGSPTTGLGFKVVFNERTHNFHISLNANPALVSSAYPAFIYAADGVNTGVPWAYDTWYNISAEFNVTPGVVRLFVDGTLIGSVGGLALTTGIDNVRIWYKADDRLPQSDFPGDIPGYLAQWQTYGNIIYYVDNIRIGSGCFADPATYTAVLELGGFPLGLAEFAFEAEPVVISDPPSTYTPYWSFTTEYGDSPTGPWSAPDPIFPNAGKVSSASAVSFNPQGAPYIRFTAQHNADGGECIAGAGLKFAELKFGTLATGLNLGTGGGKVGRVIIYTHPDDGGIGSFKLQRGETSGSLFDIPGSKIERVTAYTKDLGTIPVSSSWTDEGVISVWSSGIPGANPPSIIVVDLKENYSDASYPPVNFIRILVTETDTADGLPRCCEVEFFSRDDVTSKTTSLDITHQADITFERIDARIATLEVNNPRLNDRTFMFTKEMFQRATTGQTAIDGTAEVVVWQTLEREDEWKQLGWFAVDDPGITHETGIMSLQCRGRNEKLLIEKFPAAWKESITYSDAIRYMMTLCNIPEGFWLLPQFVLPDFPKVPVLAPIRSAWDEISDIKQAVLDAGIYFDAFGIIRRTQAETPVVLDTISREGFFHRFTEHVSHAMAGIPMAVHAVDVDIFSVLTLTGQELFKEQATTAGPTERIIQLTQPSDPLSLDDAFSPLYITRAHPKYPKVANTAAGGIIRGKVKTTESTKELVVSGLTQADDPNRTVKRTITNEYVVVKSQAISIANRELDEMAKATNWVDVEWPASPHVEVGDVFRLVMAERAVDQTYVVKKVNHQMRGEKGSGTARTIMELKDIDIP